MIKEKWMERADELIDAILTIKEDVKAKTEDLDSHKQELAQLLRDNKRDEYIGKYGKANFVEFEREGLVKDNVVDAVNGVNKGQINKIDMKDLTKDIEVCFLNVRGVM